MKRKSILFLFLILTAFCHAAVTVNVKIDSTIIFIGEQAHIELKVVAENNQKIIFPSFPDKILAPGLEVIQENISEEEKAKEGNRMSQTKTYTITSFDSALYYIPPFKVRVDDKVYPTNSLALKVETVEIDTLHLDKFFGPKDNADVPFTWNDWKPIFILSLILIILLIVLCYICIQLYNNKPLILRFRLKPALPPHQWAMNEIQKINQEKNVQEDTKEYYTRLTDVLRSYIQKRYNFNAKEMTSGEIIDHLTKQQDQTKLQELSEIFQTADLAKFAKLQTLLNENDENLLKAVDYIKATKIEIQPTQQKQVEMPPEIKRTHRSRLFLKLFIVVLSTMGLVILYFICQYIYYLFN